MTKKRFPLKTSLALACASTLLFVAASAHSYATTMSSNYEEGTLLETGDTVSDVLSYVHFDPDQLQQTIQQAAEEAVKAGHMSTEQCDALIKAYQEGLRGYTYFESPSKD